MGEMTELLIWLGSALVLLPIAIAALCIAERRRDSRRSRAGTRTRAVARRRRAPLGAATAGPPAERWRV